MSSYDREQVSAWYDVVEQYFSEAIGRLQVLSEHNDLLASGQHVAPTAGTLLSLAVHGPDPVLPDPGLARGRLREGFATEEVDAFNADARAFLERLHQQLEDQRRRLGVLLDGLARSSS